MDDGEEVTRRLRMYGDTGDSPNCAKSQGYLNEIVHQVFHTEHIIYELYIPLPEYGVGVIDQYNSECGFYEVPGLTKKAHLYYKKQRGVPIKFHDGLFHENCWSVLYEFKGYVMK